MGTVVFGTRPSPEEVNRDGTFALENLPPGEFRLRITGLPSGAYLREARLDGADVLDDGLSLMAPPRGRLDVVVGTDSGSVEASVVDERNERAIGAQVVLVPSEPRRSRSDLYHVGTSDTSGRVRFETVVPGDYKVFAWEGVPLDAWKNADFMRRYEDSGGIVRLSPLGAESVVVRMIRE